MIRDVSPFVQVSVRADMGSATSHHCIARRDASAFDGLGCAQCRKWQRIVGAKTFRLAMTARTRNGSKSRGFSCGSMLIGLLDEYERGPLHNGSAGAYEGNIDIFDLTFTRAS